MKRKITLLINKSEIAAGTRGSSLGPEAVMVAARKEDNHFFGSYPIEFSDEVNHMLDDPIKYPFAKRIEGLVTVYESVSERVKKILLSDRFPLLLAGDHASAGATIAGIKAAHPNKRLGVVWIDAHADIHSPYTTPSGNMHGMPLAIALNEDNVVEQKNSISTVVIEYWNKLKSIAFEGPKVIPEDVVFIAVRDTQEQEEAMMSRLNMINYTVDEIRAKGSEKIVSCVFEKLDKCDIIYVSFDVDSMDPSITSFGTGTSVENGLKPNEASYLLHEFGKNPKTVCIEFVEINPCLDEKKNKMAEVAFDLLKSTVDGIENN